MVMQSSVNPTYDELMTHLPLSSLGHGGRDHHKAPQHIEPGGMKNKRVRGQADI